MSKGTISSGSLLALSLLVYGAIFTARAEVPEADSSRRNVVDRGLQTVLPEDQSNDPKYIDRTANIRAAVMGRKDLSVMAHNIKIVTLSTGTVVLRGPVNSANERAEIERIAKEVSGENSVKSFIDVDNK